MNQTSPREDSWRVLRIIDANANRAAEGLRVVEDYARFVMDDSSLSERVKQLRHRLTEALAGTEQERVSMRNSTDDVGRTVQVDSEYQRASSLSVAVASIKRVQQAIRCLEEYGKQLDHQLAKACEQLRYESYELERAVVVTESSRRRLSRAQLYVLADAAGDAAEFRRGVAQLVKAGVHVIQLRDKQLSDRDLLQRANILRELTSDTPTTMIMNDRPDLAYLSFADGVHVGQDELTVCDARRILGPQKLIGVSTHSLQQAMRATQDGANYIGVGPTFPSKTKHFDSHTGLELLTAVASEVSLPSFAIGGIDLDNLSRVLSTGMTRVAVSRAVWQAEDVYGSARVFLDQLQEAHAQVETPRQVGSTR